MDLKDMLVIPGLFILGVVLCGLIVWLCTWLWSIFAPVLGLPILTWTQMLAMQIFIGLTFMGGKIKW